MRRKEILNFGQNLYNWFLSNAQSLVLMAIVVIGIYLGFKREFSKLIGFLVVALVGYQRSPLNKSAHSPMSDYVSWCALYRIVNQIGRAHV